MGAWKGPLRMKTTKGPHDNENRILAVKLPVQVGGAPVERKRLIARKVKSGAIKLDGKLSEKEWAEAETAGPFVRTMDGGAAEQKTTAKVLWDDKFVYVAFDNEEMRIYLYRRTLR